MTREECFCEACVRDRQSQHNAERTPVSRDEYNRLVFEQVKELRQVAREEGRKIDLHDAAILARQIVSDFYEIEEPVDDEERRHNAVLNDSNKGFSLL